jgi:RNA polymerase sigma-70 factor (ECF subfamily)
VFLVLTVIKTLFDRNEQDVRLLDQIAKRDQAAFAQLYDRYSPLVFTLLSRIVKSSADAEDLLQDIFLQIWGKSGTYAREKGSVYTWIVAISRNRAIDRMRGGDMSKRSGTVDDLLHEVGEEGHTSSPLFATISSEYEGLMRDGLATLSHEQQRIIEMSYYEGYTQEEISKSLSVPLGTVKTRMRQGIIRLRNFLKGRIDR